MGRLEHFKDIAHLFYLLSAVHAMLRYSLFIMAGYGTLTYIRAHNTDVLYIRHPPVAVTMPIVSLVHSASCVRPAKVHNQDGIDYHPSSYHGQPRRLCEGESLSARDTVLTKFV